MVRADFVRQMKDAIAKRAEREENNQKAALHCAEVIKADGIRKWTALRKEIDVTVKEIAGPLSYANEGEYSTRIGYGSEFLTIHFDRDTAKISVSGFGGHGTFVPNVHGQELAYSYVEPESGNVRLHGPDLSVERIAEQLIKTLLGPELSALLS